MKKYLITIIPIIAIVVLAAGLWLLLKHSASAPTGFNAENASNDSVASATAFYACDNEKTISAAFFPGAPATTTPAEGEPPIPTDRVEVSFDGTASTTLRQTISADGARFANADESLVFWNKGNEALIMRNNSMDLEYTNCMDVRARKG